MDYDYIAHIDKLTDDLPFILRHMNATDLTEHFPSNKGHVQDDSNKKYKEYFLNATFSLVKPVLEKFRVDADMFGYSFADYVKEKNKHKITWL